MNITLVLFLLYWICGAYVAYVADPVGTIEQPLFRAVRASLIILCWPIYLIAWTLQGKL
jgi:hypothetical protein